MVIDTSVLSSRPRWVLGLFFLIPSISCTDSMAESHEFRHEVHDGIPLAITTGGPRWTGEIFEYEFQLCLKEDEREESLLYEPEGFLLDANGWFYVSDEGNHRIAVFDPEGRYVRSIGRGGQGPGEFRWIQPLEIETGVLSAFDPNQLRVTRYQLDGTLIEVVPLDRDGLITSIRAYWDLPNGEALLRSFNLGAEPGNASGVAGHQSLMVFERAGHTLWRHETTPVAMGTTKMMFLEGEEAPIPVVFPWSPAPEADYHPTQGIVVSPGTDSELYILDTSGSLLRRIRIELQAEPPTVSEVEEGLAAVQATIESMDDPMSRAIFSPRLEVFDEPPEAKAHWTTVDVDDDGFIWLRLPDLAIYHRSEQVSISYRIVSPEGEYLGITTIPEASWARPTRGRLLTKQLDPSSGVELLCSYGIRPLVRDLEYPMARDGL